jgi:hypothetical protein
MAPRATQRATLQKDDGTDTRTVKDGEFFNVEHQSRHGELFPQTASDAFVKAAQEVSVNLT